MTTTFADPSASFCSRGSMSAVGKSTAAMFSPVHAPTASPSSQISAPSGPLSPSTCFSGRRICSTSGAAALNCWRMPPGQSSRSVAPISGSSSSTRWSRAPACHADVMADTAWDTLG
jgi:hypothetical protein